jgi:hypothetical protein
VRTSIGVSGGDVSVRRELRWFICSRKAPCNAYTISWRMERDELGEYRGRLL